MSNLNCLDNINLYGFIKLFTLNSLLIVSNFDRIIIHLSYTQYASNVIQYQYWQMISNIQTVCLKLSFTLRSPIPGEENSKYCLTLTMKIYFSLENVPSNLLFLTFV